MLFNICSVCIVDMYTVLAGDDKGMVQMVSLNQLSLDKLASSNFDHHHQPIEAIRVEKLQDKRTGGFMMVTYSGGCFTLWNSNKPHIALRTLYLNIESTDNLVLSLHVARSVIVRSDEHLQCRFR
jgi:hypothetical protein